LQDPWLDLLENVLRPARPLAGACRPALDRHLAERTRIAEGRAAALAGCEKRIHEARSVIFDAGDGVVGWHMTELEREWRRLARRDPDAGIMDLWAAIAPPAWIDRKLWRDSPEDSRLDAAVALASDAEGALEAEGALASLLPGRRVRWSLETRDAEAVVPLLERPLHRAAEACPADAREAIVERARRAEQTVHEAAIERFASRPNLARDLAFAAFVDFVWRASRLPTEGNPVDPLRRFWSTGYVLSEVDASSVTVEIPPFRATRTERPVAAR